MNLKILKIYSQNIYRNKLLTETILEKKKYKYNIVFIQEPPWYPIRWIPSYVSADDKLVIEALHYLI